jgi:imidazole glycerol-phosphate synthase subunit HisH
MISIVDYGLGNVFAFRNAYERLNIPVALVRTPAEVENATRLILPGVGAFDRAMEQLDASGLRAAIEEFALVKKGPLLGVCVGMQMLAESSEEGQRRGLGWINGEARRFPGDAVALPHMGWNNVAPASQQGLFDGMNGDSRFYFLHSFYVECHDRSDVLAVADYGGAFCCAVNRGNIFGVQFHPEKSHRWGTRLLKNFAEI